MSRGLADRTGLVTEQPLFGGLSLPEPGDFVMGGHDIRETSFGESAEEFRANSGVFEAGWISACEQELAAATARVRPGTLSARGARLPVSVIGVTEGPRGQPTRRSTASPPTWPPSSTPRRSTT